MLLVGGEAPAEPPRTIGTPPPAAIPRGLDAFMPRGGAWQRALEAARAGRYRTAETLVLDAAAEIRRVARGGSVPCIANGEGVCLKYPPRALVRGLLRKTTWFLQQVRKLADSDPPLRPGSPGATDERLAFAIALDNVYQAARAFDGREPVDLGRQAEQAWREALRAGSTEEDVAVRARLGLAGLLATRGDRTAAQAEFTRVPASQRTPELVDFVARYHAAMGDRDAAFESLFAARDALPNWEEAAAIMRVGNDLDPLRGDPRFEQLFGAE